MNAIIGGTVYTPTQILENASILIEGGHIIAIGIGDSPADSGDLNTIDAHGKLVVPGFIDVHIHGLLGYDSMGAGLSEVIAHLPEYGTTAFMATTITLPDNETIQQLQVMNAILNAHPNGARCLGIHLEGPFMSSQRPGMATISWMKALNTADFERYQSAAGGNIRMLTFAPEEGDAMAAIPALIAYGVIPVIGHSEATYEQAKQSIELGVNHSTHTYNAMSPLRHREPGVVGAVVTHPQVFAELIADGIHVHPAAMQVLLKMKGLDRLVLVSDAAPLAGLPDGKWEWEHKPVYIRNQVVQLEDGTLAGAHMLLDSGVRNLVQMLNLPLEDALVPATMTAAESVGIGERKGQLAIGYDADIAILEENLSPWMTIVEGEIVWRKDNQ